MPFQLEDASGPQVFGVPDHANCTCSDIGQIKCGVSFTKGTLALCGRAGSHLEKWNGRNSEPQFAPPLAALTTVCVVRGRCVRNIIRVRSIPRLIR